MRNEVDMPKIRIAEAAHGGTPYDQLAEQSGNAWRHHEFGQPAESPVWSQRPYGVSPPEENATDKRLGLRDYACPACEGKLAVEMIAVRRPDLNCRFCQFPLWCRRSVSWDGIVLEALPGPAPESWEITRVVECFKRKEMPDRATLDLSKFEIMNSSWLASLVGFKRALQVCGCTLILCGIRPYVGEIFKRLHFDSYFAIVPTCEPN